MADDRQNIIDLTQITIEKVLLEQKNKLLDVESKEFKQNEARIKQIKLEIEQKKAALTVGKSTIGQITTEIAKKKELQKIYEEHVKIIQQSGKSIKEQNKLITQLQKNMSKESGQEIRDTTSTFGTLFSLFKGFDVKKLATTWTSAGKGIGVLSNSLKALTGAGSVAAGAIAATLMAAEAWHEHIFSPFAKQRNVLGQTLGIGYEGREYFQTKMFSNFMKRVSLGYTPDEYVSLLAAGANVSRKGGMMPAENIAEKMGQVNRLWGTNISSLVPIFKAYKQQELPEKRLASHFTMLMENIENTGFTTQEFTDILANSAMYLKNFGVDLDRFAKNLTKYGEYIEKGQISITALTPQNVNKADTGQMAFLAQMLQKYGFVNFGLDKNAGPMAWARALKDIPINGESMKRMLTQIALKPGSELHGILGGARNQRELELTVAEMVDTILPKLASAYNISTGEMKSSDVYKYVTEELRNASWDKGEKSPEKVANEAINAQFMGASIKDKSRQILGVMSDWLSAQATSVNLTQKVVNKMQAIVGDRVSPISGTDINTDFSFGGNNANP